MASDQTDKKGIALRELSEIREKYAESAEYNSLPASLKAIYNTDKFLDDILFGDIEWPTIPERDDLEKPVNSSNGHFQSQFVWLVEATGFIARHLKRWIEEQLTPELSCWYRFDKPFTNRLRVIQNTCENLLNVLPARLPDFQQRFMEKYEELKRVALEADSSRTCDLENSIHNFKSASEAFYKTMLIINSEAFVYIKGTKPASGGNVGDTKTEDKKTSSGFSVKNSQVFYDGKDLGFPAGQIQEFFEKLMANMGLTVKYTELEQITTIEKIRGYKYQASKILKHHSVPYEIISLANEGYVLRSISE